MIQEKYLNPFTDFGFKKLFGEEPNKDLLIDFLNQVLPEKHRVKDLTYRKSEFGGISEFDRRAFFDLYCESQSGEKFIVEMQKAKQNFFKDRSLFYATFAIQEQAPRGIWDFKLTAVYFIGILDFVFAENQDNDEVKHEIVLKNQRNEVFYDKLTFIYLEMPKFQKTEDELETNFDKWLYVLKNLPMLDEKPRKLREKIFTRLFETAQIAKFNRAERANYEESLKIYRDLINVVNTAAEEGQTKGFKKGMKKGLAEGVKKGLAEGKAEGEQTTKLEIAKMMKLQGEPIEKIMAYTNLSEQEIGKL
jgi:predicted transposase/invertase (TIGR01784 family)